ncbi:MAG: TRAP transporter TatT component family protein [Spirochaetaceae bacterium]|jgi:predicted anti-sigma-YlaC factor YlaD|nr:TRAP transporter TatT component family protein [Spirochaetaceae bacterium]
MKNGENGESAGKSAGAFARLPSFGGELHCRGYGANRVSGVNASRKAKYVSRRVNRPCGADPAPDLAKGVDLFHGVRYALLLLICGVSLFSCTTQQIAMRSSPEFVASMLPGIIKKNEAKLKKNPDSQKLILETGSYYVMDANAFVQGPASMLPPEKYAEREAEYKKARLMYLRGAEILEDGLERRHPGVIAAAREGETDVFKSLTKDDVPYIYWLTAAVLSAFSLDPMDLSTGMKVGEVSRLIQYAYILDPDFNNGALDDFFILYYASLPPSMGGDLALAKEHYKRALEKTRFLSASPYVSWAQAACIPAQNFQDFKYNLNKALSINVNKDMSNKLLNVLAQRKARYLLDNADIYFIDTNDTVNIDNIDDTGAACGGTEDN